MNSKNILQNILLALLVVSISVSTTYAAKKNKIVASRDDLKYIGCEVCEKMVTILKSEIDPLKPYKPRKELMELQVLEPIESVCNPNNATGEWIRKLDITEVVTDGVTHLKLVEQKSVGKCGLECVTIAQSCQNILDHDLDHYELAQAFIHKRQSTVRDFQKKVCHSMTSRCKKPSPSLDPKYSRVDSPFVPITTAEFEAEKTAEGTAKKGGGSAAAQMFGRDYVESVKEEVRDGLETPVDSAVKGDIDDEL